MLHRHQALVTVEVPGQLLPDIEHSSVHRTRGQHTSSGSHSSVNSCGTTTEHLFTHQAGAMSSRSWILQCSFLRSIACGMVALGQEGQMHSSSLTSCSSTTPHCFNNAQTTTIQK